MRAFAERQNQHRARAVHRIAGGDLLRTGLQERALVGFLHSDRTAQDRRSCRQRYSHRSSTNRRAGRIRASTRPSDSGAESDVDVHLLGRERRQMSADQFASSRISFDSTSSFFCTLPCTFSAPADPSTPPGASLPIAIKSPCTRTPRLRSAAQVGVEVSLAARGGRFMDVRVSGPGAHGRGSPALPPSLLTRGCQQAGRTVPHVQSARFVWSKPC